MPTRTVEESLATAERANNYVRSFALQSTTHANFSDLERERQREVFFGLHQNRQEYRAAGRYGLGPSSEINQYNKSLNAKNTGIANCAENAYLALDYIATNEPEAYAEAYAMGGSADHVFCVVDRDKTSDPKDPKTWGPNAHVCDPWSNEVYPATQLAQERTYQASTVTAQITAQDPEIVESHKTPSAFRPNEHDVSPQKDLNTDLIRQANAQQDLGALNEMYQKKSQLINQGLVGFKSELDVISARLNQDSNELSREKAKIVDGKRAAVQQELNGCEMEKPHNSISDYSSVCASLG